MPFTGPFEDRLAIRELLEAYGDAVTQRDVNAWAACWAEEGRWCLPDLPGWEEIKGKQTIVAEWLKMMEAFHGPADKADACIFISTPCAIQVTQNTATGRTYTTETYTDAKGVSRRILSEYADKFVKRNGQWLFSERSWKMLPIEDAAALSADARSR
jgi:ketosteroid isomerase-like protein